MADPSVQAHPGQQRGAVLERECLDYITANIEQVRQNAANVNRASRERADFLNNLATVAHGVVEAIGGISQTTRINRDRLNKTAGRTQAITDGAQRIYSATEGNIEAASSLADAFTDFFERFAEVRGILSDLSGIARQTNLLSLNAMIEAKHAGEAGAGFAVVANEVKSLAGHTQESSAKIGDVIDALSQSLEHLGERVDNLTGGLKESDSSFRASFHEIAEVGKIVEEAAEAANKASDSSAQQIETFKEIVDHIEAIRADTEKAIAGSQKNIEICDSVLETLRRAEAETQTTLPHSAA